MGSPGDFIKYVQQIVGTSAPEVTPVDGIYWDLTIALTGSNNNAGKYGHIVEMYAELAGPGGSYDDFVLKYADFTTKYADVLVQSGIATQAAIDATTAQVLAEASAQAANNSAVVAAASNVAIESKLSTVQANGSTVESNLDAVATSTADIGVVAGISGEVSAVASAMSDILAANTNATDIATVATATNAISTVADDLQAITEVATGIAGVAIVADIRDEINVLANEPVHSLLLSAGGNAIRSELAAWESEANRRTAASYATEDINTFVKLWNSVGDGTFIYTNTTVFSARHYSKIDSGIRKFVGYYDVGTSVTLPADGTAGEFYVISTAGNIDGIVDAVAVGDELRWNTLDTVWDVYRVTLPYDRLLVVPENVSNAQSRSERGVANGYVPLNTDRLIDSQYLPSYVDDVIEVPTLENLPTTGESGKLYIVIADESLGGDTSTYRWTGSVYALVSNSLTEADVKNLYEANANTNEYSDAEKTSVDIATTMTTAAQTLPTAINELDSDIAAHNADTTNPHAVTKLQVGLGNADDTSDLTKNAAVGELTNKTITSYTNKIHADQLHVRVKCVDAAGILVGQAVMFSGYNSGEDAIEVVLADNTVGVAIGLAEEDMANGVFGTITMNGIIEGLDTSSYTEGQILYISTAGALTAVEPTTGFSQPLAFVLRPHSVNGALQVNASYPKQDAGDVRNTPAGGIVAVTVQDAIAELDADKFDKTGGTVTGTINGRDLVVDGAKLDIIEDGATADQTGAEIKTLYEGEADTNAYTDTEKAQLSGLMIVVEW